MEFLRYVSQKLRFHRNIFASQKALRLFCLDIEAVKIAEICKISENSVGKYCKALRILMACECEKISKLSGEIEIDESFFGAGRVRGKLGQRSWQRDDSFSRNVA